MTLCIADMTALEFTKWATIVAMACLAFAGFLKCLFIARRSTTSHLCVHGLTLICAALIIAVLLANSETVKQSYWLTVLTVLHMMVLLVAGVVVAIVGLADYRRHPEYVQGRKQAIAAIVIGGLILVPMGIGGVKASREGWKRRNAAASMGSDPTRSGEVLRNEQFNYQITAPGKPWVRMKPEQVNPLASLAMMRSGPQMFFMVIAEASSSIAIDSKLLMAISQGNLQSNGADVTITEETAHEVNGMSGYRFCTDATISGIKLSYVHWVAAANGYAYQFIVWGGRQDRALVRTEADRLLGTFRQIDAQRRLAPAKADVASSTQDAREAAPIPMAPTSGEIVRNDELNYQIRVPGKPWTSLKPECFGPAASVALMRTNPQIFFMVIAEGVAGGEGNSKRLMTISQENLKRNATGTTITDEVAHEVNGMSGYRFYSDATVSGAELSYAHWVVAVNGYYYQLICWGSQQDREQVRVEANRLMKGFRQIDPQRQASVEEETGKD